MAMAGRAARRTGFESRTTTPSNIGPGTYDLVPQTKTRTPLAAFGVSGKREGDWIPATDTPGPGSYSLNKNTVNENMHSSSGGAHGGNSSISEKYKGSNAFKSQAPRMAPLYPGSSPFKASTVILVPGPGAYETAATFAKPDTSHGAAKLKQMMAARQSNATASPIPPPRYNPPTIPRRDQSFGYNEAPGGVLVPATGPTVGYCGGYGGMGSSQRRNGDDSVSSALTGGVPDSPRGGGRACNFAKYSERKELFEETVIHNKDPGPGEYNPQMAPVYRVPDRGSASFLSGVDRLKQNLPDGPGPSSYSPETVAGKLGQGVGGFQNGSTLQCFGSTSSRSVWLRNGSAPYNDPPPGHATPGPGTYENAAGRSSFTIKPRRTLRETPVPFGETSTRPCLVDPTSSPRGGTDTAPPGPASYAPEGYGSISTRLKVKAGVGRKGVFGASGERWKKKSDAPGPSASGSITGLGGMYDQGKIPKKVLVLHRQKVPSPGFRTPVGKQLDDIARAEKLPPPPTTYVIKGEFDLLADARQTFSANPKRSQSFNSTAKRVTVFDAMQTDANEGPGPAAYNTSTNSGDRVRVLHPRSRVNITARCPLAERFEDPKLAGSAGPGSYDVSGSLLTRTFNVTFTRSKPTLRRRIRSAPRAPNAFSYQDGGINTDSLNIGGSANVSSSKADIISNVSGSRSNNNQVEVPLEGERTQQQ